MQFLTASAEVKMQSTFLISSLSINVTVSGTDVEWDDETYLLLLDAYIN